MEDEEKVDRTVVRILDLKTKENDFAFWQTQTYEQRLEALEKMRLQYILWKYGSEQRLQRVLRIVDRPQR